MTEAADEFETLHEIVKRARENLSRDVWDYVVGGAETETTLKRNRQALDSIAFRPRVLRDVSAVDCSSTFLGERLRIPVVLAPIGSLEDVESGGGVTVARAAGEFGVASMLSSVCRPGLEEVAAASDGPLIYNLYVRGDADWIADHVRRAVDAGCRAFSVTVDSAIYGRRERDLAKRYKSSARRRFTGMEFQAGFTWDHVKRIRDAIDIPLIVKGIATAEDAATACALGIDVIYVSNHGGRQLDHGLGAIEVLPEVVREVGAKAAVVVDGGFMRGTDIVKAIVLGADAVGIGRLLCFGLAAAGQAGLVRVLELLETEIKTCLALLGADRFDVLDQSYLHPAQPVDRAHGLSAFPLLDEGY